MRRKKANGGWGEGGRTSMRIEGKGEGRKNVN
jgi:hypothetical protein